MTKKKSFPGMRDGTCTATPEEIEAASHERPDLDEYAKNYLCGTCCVGWDTIEEFMQHIASDEHSYHKARNVSRLVPGLGFCGACYCIMQMQQNWDKHVTGVKHKKCVASLEAAEAAGATKQCPNYNFPLSCEAKGVLGPMISGSEIDCALANTYGFGHGGAMAENTPIVGMNYISKLKSDEIAASTRQLAGESRGGVFRCSLCEEDFVFFHRARHMHSAAHRTKYLAKHYPERVEDVKSVKYRVLKLLYHCAQVEEEDKQSDTEEAKSLRKIFSSMPKTGHRDALPRAERERVQAEKYKIRHSDPDYSSKKSRGRDYNKRRNMNFDIESVPYGRPPREKIERKPLLSDAARNFLKNADRTQVNFPSASRDPYQEEPGYPYTPTGLDRYGVPRTRSRSAESYGAERSAARYAALGIRHPWEDGSGQSGYGPSRHDQRPSDVKQPPHTEEALAALAVLEKFAESQAKGDVTSKIDELKKGVLSGSGIGAESIGALAGSLAGPPAPSSSYQTQYPPAQYPSAHAQGRYSFDSFVPGASHMGAYPTDASGYPTYTNQPIGYEQPYPPPRPSYNGQNTGPQTKFYTKSRNGKDFMPITDALGGDYSKTGYNYNYQY